MLRNAEGHQIALPPNITHAKVKQAEQERLRLLDALAGAHADRERAQRARDAAGEQDRQASATAARAGDPLPDAAKTAQADVDLAAADRQVEALTLASEQATATLMDIIESSRDAWQHQAEADVERARAKYADAVEHLTACHRDLREALGTLGFVQGFPQRSFKPGGRVALPLLGPNREPIMVEAILAGLATLADPPAPPNHVAPGVAQQGRAGQQPVMPAGVAAAVTVGGDDVLRGSVGGWAA